MKIKDWNKLDNTNKRIFMLLTKELYELSLITKNKYEVILINGKDI